MPEKISIVKESGETLVSNIVSVFTIPETEKRYMITTENAVDPHGLTILHVSEIVDGVLQKVATDEEWSSIKTIMRAIISGNVGSYKYLPTVNSIKSVGQYSRDISVSASASKQMVDNYNASDKGMEGANESAAPVEEQSQVTASSIFPTDVSPVSNDDELVPGIAELSGNVPEPVVPVQPEEVPVSQPVVPEQPVMDIGSGPVVTPPPIIGGGVPLETEQPIVPGQNPIPPVALEQPAIPGTPVMPADPLGQSVLPVVPDLMASAEPIAPVSPVDVIPPVGGEQPAVIPESNIIGGSIDINPVVPQPVTLEDNLNTVVTTPAQADLNNSMLVDNVQVATPTTIVPDAQIVQGVQNPMLNDTQINFNAAPSFDPNATLDEVAVAAQQMFMEGVKNLVQTIQEKVYRDLYAKEAELKNREALIAQKEQELGSQVASSAQIVAPPVMNNNVIVPSVSTPVVNEVQPVVPAPTVQVQPVVPQQPVATPQPIIPTPVINPTVVQTTNDVI